MRPRILVVDDEPNMTWLFQQSFGRDYEVVGATCGEEALRIIKRSRTNLVMLDLKLNRENGIDVLRSIKQFDPALPVIMMTAYATVQTAVEAMKIGAQDYIMKPFNLEELRDLIQKTLRSFPGRCAPPDKYYRREIVGVSQAMMEVFSIVERVAQTDASVLLQGESGTGKELIAKAIHFESPRRHRPFVPINCAALPENLLESELFGYEEGAFTGAKGRKPGKFELAHEGTLLLDEIGDMPLVLQAKMLRVLEEKEVERLGSTKRIPVDVRIIASTNKDLKELVRKGQFREDLYFRLAVVPISLPPLRERREDIPILAKHFLQTYSSKHGKRYTGFSNKAMECLLQYPWPGNVRELRNLIEQIVILGSGPEVSCQDLPPYMRITDTSSKTSEAADPPSYSLRQLRKDIEREAIIAALQQCDHNRTRAAEKLKISRRSLQMKIKAYGLSKPGPNPN